MSLETRVDILEDPQGILTVNDVNSEPYASKFIPNPDKNINRGMTLSVYWFRFRLTDNRTLPGNLVLSCNSATLREVTLFLPAANQGKTVYTEMHGGWNTRKVKQDTGFITPAFSFSGLEAKQGYLYLRVRTPYTMSFGLDLFSVESFEVRSWFLIMLVFTCIGILSAMTLYNISLYLFLKDRQYLIYVIYMISQILYQVTLTGAGRLFNRGAGDLLLFNLVQSGSIMTLMAAWFAREFNFTKQNAPVHYHVLTAMMAFACITAAMSWGGYEFYANRFIFIIGLLLMLLVLSTGITVFLKGYRPALYFIVAWSMIVVGATVFALRGLGIVPTNVLTFYAILISTALESILLSFALAHRIRILQDERDFLQKEKSRLSTESLVDELSGLNNRRFFERFFPRMIEKAHYSGQPLSLLVVDIDYMKTYNDTYGHQEGDRLIAAVGQAIMSSIRSDDRACRYGGEEFVVIMPGAELSEARRAAERISRRFSEQRFCPKPGIELQWSISVGVAQLALNETAASFFKRTDQVLYKAKAAGRSRIEIA